jgi:isoaspartyl peptidase/L-asparaginase-like protein (Ntn-hydrolase superfamily)
VLRANRHHVLVVGRKSLKHFVRRNQEGSRKYITVKKQQQQQQEKKKKTRQRRQRIHHESLVLGA